MTAALMPVVLTIVEVRTIYADGPVAFPFTDGVTRRLSVYSKPFAACIQVMSLDQRVSTSEKSKLFVCEERAWRDL